MHESYIVVRSQVQGSESMGFDMTYTSDMEQQPSRERAVSHGWEVHGHDDWLILRLVDGNASVLSWMDEERGDQDELGEVARQLGVEVADAPVLAVTSTPTIMSGEVLRWYEFGETPRSVMSASREGVQISGYLHEVPVSALAAGREAHRLLAEGQDVSHLVTHRRTKVVGGELVPVGDGAGLAGSR